MNFFTILLCLVAAPAAFADNTNPQQNAVELDRARSAWNFGGHHPIKKSAYWNRPRNVAGPGAVIANRRLGSGSAPMAPHTKKTLGAPQRRRQHKPHSPKSTHQGQGRPLTKRNTNAAPFAPTHQSSYPQTYPMSYFPNQSKLPASPSWHRSSRKLGVDPIKSRFMKEELWHLDKGEGYALKDEDLDRDSLLRNRHYENNEIEEPQVNSLHSAVHQHQHKLEKDAENMVSHSVNAGNSTHQTQPHIVHHHHHYSVPKNESKNRTPSLTRRRRRRSADMQMPSDAQTQTLLQQLFGNNQRMTPVVTRKHYSNHIGNGKNQNSAGSPNHGSYKVPATIIAPPQFDKDDVLTMLLGSGGVTADAMGTVVATNNRYVRYGRGLPNGRRGRQLQWGTESNIRNSPQSQPQSSNHIPYVPKYSKKPISPAKKPMVHLTPPPKAPVQQAPAPSHQAHQPHPPLILNVQISPMPAARHNNGPVINFPVQQQQQQQPMMLQQQQPAQQINYVQQQQQQINHGQQQVQEMATSEPISVPAQHQQQPTVPQDQQPQQPIVIQEHQQQSVAIPEQQQPPVIQDQQPVASQEKQQQSMDYPIVKEQQQSTIQVEESQPMPVLEEKAPTMPYQIVYVSPNGKSKNPFKYTEWMPVYQGKPKPQKAYNYDQSSYVEPYDSKNLYRKMKPYFNKQKQSGESSPALNHYDNINDQLTDSSMTKTYVGSADYDSFSQNYDIDLSSLINSNGDHGESNLLDSTAPLPPSYTSNSWQDNLNQVNHDEVIDSKSLSYAVKNNYKNELDNVLQDISSRENDIYSNSMHSENNDVYSSNNFDSFAKSYAANNDVYSNNNFDSVGTNYASNERDSYSQNYLANEQDSYSQPEKYYTVKKVPDQLPDPIYINVPKEDEFSNELYDVRK